jgi:hypothetical protein
VIKFVSDLQHLDVFLRVLLHQLNWLPRITVEVALNTITPIYYEFVDNTMETVAHCNELNQIILE